ncbi:energy transducer TonB, partial [Pseudomonas gingeri]|nr:energy transducer TonB [Pseudomonas gingeri]
MGNVQTAASAHEVRRPQAPGGELVDIGRLHRAPLGQLRLQKVPKGILSRREAILLGVFALVLHGAVIYWLSQQQTPVLPVVPPEIPPMTIEFSQPAPPVVEPPPPVPPPPPPPVVEPPPPVVDELAVKPP